MEVITRLLVAASLALCACVAAAQATTVTANQMADGSALLRIHVDGTTRLVGRTHMNLNNAIHLGGDHYLVDVNLRGVPVESQSLDGGTWTSTAAGTADIVFHDIVIANATLGNITAFGSSGLQLNLNLHGSFSGSLHSMHFHEVMSNGQMNTFELNIR
jgi:hypothetical protein